MTPGGAHNRSLMAPSSNSFARNLALGLLFCDSDPSVPVLPVVSFQFSPVVVSILKTTVR
jgi:hypothetical protein